MQTFLLKSIGEDGSVLWSEEVQAVEIEPFEDDPVLGKGKIEIEYDDGDEAFEVYPDGHDHWAWECVS